MVFYIVLKLPMIREEGTMSETTTKKESQGSKEFSFPANTKQMGSIDKDIKIYIEDYVYTYIYQYAKTEGSKEKLMVLVGKHMFVNDMDIIFISGAIQGKFASKDNGIMLFTDESWEYINNNKNKFFSDCSIMGWCHIQPEFGTFMMSKDEIFHKKCFKNKFQVFAAIDPAEKQESFYIYNEDMTSLRPAKGFFIYYEKNEDMREYMLENSINKKMPDIDFDEEKTTDSASSKTALHRLLGIKERNKKEEIYVPDRIDAASKIRKVLDKKEEEKKEKNNRHFILNTMCACLLCACFLIGWEMVQGKDRIKVLEREIVTIKTSYNEMAEKLEETVRVFAAESKEEIVFVQDEMIEPEVTEEKQTAEYIVEEGDNMWYICREFYDGENKIDEIKVLNGIENEDIIYVGQMLLLP